MAKDLQWFKFSPLNWMTGRIRREKEKVQISFIELMCQYWKNECSMTLDQAELEIGDSIHHLMKKKIVKQSGDFIKIDFLDNQMSSIEHTSEQRSNAAKSRWNANAMQMHASALQNGNSAMQNDADKIREDKKRESITHGKGKLTITIRPVFTKDPIHQIHDLKEYYKSTGQLSALEEVGFIHFQPFMKENSGKMFNEPDHLYNTFRNFCREYKPPALAPNKFITAEVDKENLTPEAWEKMYAWDLKNNEEFKQHFNGKLSLSKSVGL